MPQLPLRLAQLQAVFAASSRKVEIPTKIVQESKKHFVTKFFRRDEFPETDRSPNFQPCEKMAADADADADADTDADRSRISKSRQKYSGCV